MDVVDIITTVVPCVVGVKYVPESYIVPVTGIGREINPHKFSVGGSVVDGFYRHKGVDVVQIAHHTHLQLVFYIRLF